MNALIATLGTMGIYRGVAVLLGGPGITFLPDSFSRPGQVVILGLQGPVWMMAVIALLFSFLLSRTPISPVLLHRQQCHRCASFGIDVPRPTDRGIRNYGRTRRIQRHRVRIARGTSVSISGDGAELRIITAAILGGASLTGGKGIIWGALIGVGFIALINNALIIASVSAYWQSIITGIVLVAAVAMDRFMKKD